MKKINYFISAIILFFFVVLSINKAQESVEAKGKLLFKDYKCTSCHAIESQGFLKKGKSSAPDLSDVGDRIKPDFMKKYLTKEEKLNDLKHAISFKGNDEEFKTLIEWLSALKKEEAKKESK